MTRGLITGRFCPPHLGHKQLIGTARRRVDMLTVAIDTRANDAIAADLRMSWLKEIHPDCVMNSPTTGSVPERISCLAATLRRRNMHA
ncbi:MAG: adenylyltransferase/cytidyltransferase family protein [Pyrinomonadaceae bacterium]|nr:adenylyltransferase/cytidyltransferase family protein [Pyrinomonadaceae bacterium]